MKKLSFLWVIAVTLLVLGCGQENRIFQGEQLPGGEVSEGYVIWVAEEIVKKNNLNPDIHTKSITEGVLMIPVVSDFSGYVEWDFLGDPNSPYEFAQWWAHELRPQVEFVKDESGQGYMSNRNGLRYKYPEDFASHAIFRGVADQFDPVKTLLYVEDSTGVEVRDIGSMERLARIPFSEREGDITFFPLSEYVDYFAVAQKNGIQGEYHVALCSYEDGSVHVDMRQLPLCGGYQYLEPIWPDSIKIACQKPLFQKDTPWESVYQRILPFKEE